MLRTSTAIAMIAALGVTPALATTWTFDQIDSDDNAELTSVEFGSVASEAVKSLDTNDDGVVSAEEFEANHPELGIDVSQPVAEWDASGDGFLDENDLRDGMYGAYDTNTDQVLEESEFDQFSVADAGETAGGGESASETLQSNRIIGLADWNYSSIYNGGISLDWLIGSDALNEAGDDLGQVENVLLAPDGKVLSIVAEIGGFFELADTHVNIPWDKVEMADNGVIVPVTADNIEDYSLFQDEYLRQQDAASNIQKVEGDGPGEVITGPRVWRATELIGDYARIQENGIFRGYGIVDDVVIADGQVSATIISPDGVGGYYGYPYYGSNWDVGSPYYDLPYERSETGNLEPFNYDELDATQPSEG
ncbi:PRC-barrel domain-containing protein [Devosia sp. PTR5]|uniref:PRC-barrel domain-containing protein n=1 Tax=Devosia oryzisoli TaxID=2774138 RepID=A0A927IT16_9HYPH|nr:PRC-barrel domain-containing protein [Devosia oryzisoli]MBD8066079.1 PRC-barrel domain-containing protein [Devosia oryzisoli]